MTKDEVERLTKMFECIITYMKEEAKAREQK